MQPVKLKQQKILHAIVSLGFRGEAPLLLQQPRLTLTSSQDESGIGHQVE